MSTRAKSLPCGRSLLIQSQDGTNPAAFYWQRLDKFVSSQKLNRSESRRKVVQVVLGQTSHFTALELVKKVQSSHPGVGAATVYRNLPVLVAAGILRESLSKEDGQVVYELDGAGDHHDHIVCLDCDAILEFHEAKIESLQEKTLA
jgi:Fur family transcriptional regulator, ferric uptake regulator